MGQRKRASGLGPHCFAQSHIHQERGTRARYCKPDYAGDTRRCANAGPRQVLFGCCCCAVQKPVAGKGDQSASRICGLVSLSDPCVLHPHVYIDQRITVAAETGYCALCSCVRSMHAVDTCCVEYTQASHRLAPPCTAARRRVSGCGGRPTSTSWIPEPDRCSIIWHLWKVTFSTLGPGRLMAVSVFGAHADAVCSTGDVCALVSTRLVRYAHVHYLT